MKGKKSFRLLTLIMSVVLLVSLFGAAGTAFADEDEDSSADSSAAAKDTEKGESAEDQEAMAEDAETVEALEDEDSAETAESDTPTDGIAEAAPSDEIETDTTN